MFVSVTLLCGVSGTVWGGGGPTVGGSFMIKPASRNFALELEHLQAMQQAFDAVCATLQLSASSEDKATALIGEKVIALAMTGERDADRLTARVLAEFGVENDGSLWRH